MRPGFGHGLNLETAVQGEWCPTLFTIYEDEAAEKHSRKKMLFYPRKRSVKQRQCGTSKMVLEAIAMLNERAGSDESSIRETIKGRHPNLPTMALGRLPIVLRKLERTRALKRTAHGTYTAKSQSPTAIAREYFTRMFEKRDTEGTGRVPRADLPTVLRPNNLFHTSNLVEISTHLASIPDANIKYNEFIPKLTTIVLQNARRDAPQEGIADEDDWDRFARAMSNLTLHSVVSSGNTGK